jgi:hypothetical protein
MNLADLLVPKVANPCKAEAERAESQHPRGPGNPPTGAERGGL